MWWTPTSCARCSNSTRVSSLLPATLSLPFGQGDSTAHDTKLCGLPALTTTCNPAPCCLLLRHLPPSQPTPRHAAFHPPPRSLLVCAQPLGACAEQLAPREQVWHPRALPGVGRLEMRWTPRGQHPAWCMAGLGVMSDLLRHSLYSLPPSVGQLRCLQPCAWPAGAV